jgi:hypothetical protein
MVRRTRSDGAAVHVGYIDDTGHEVPAEDVEGLRTAAYPASA